MVARQPLGGVRESRPPRFQPGVHLFSRTEKEIPGVRRVLQRFRPGVRSNGKYLYFLSQRYFYPSFGQLDQRFNYYSTDGVFAVTLKAEEASPFGPQSDEEKAAEEKKDEKKEGGEAKPAANAKGEEKKGEEKKAEEKPVKPIQVDTDGIQNRIVAAPIPAGIYRRLAARKDKFFYIAIPIEATQAALPGPPRPHAILHVFDVTKREDKVLLEGINNYDLDKDGGKVIYRAGT